MTTPRSGCARQLLLRREPVAGSATGADRRRARQFLVDREARGGVQRLREGHPVAELNSGRRRVFGRTAAVDSSLPKPQVTRLAARSKSTTAMAFLAAALGLSPRCLNHNHCGEQSVAATLSTLSDGEQAHCCGPRARRRATRLRAACYDGALPARRLADEPAPTARARMAAARRLERRLRCSAGSDGWRAPTAGGTSSAKEGPGARRRAAARRAPSSRTRSRRAAASAAEDEAEEEGEVVASRSPPPPRTRRSRGSRPS